MKRMNRVFQVHRKTLLEEFETDGINSVYQNAKEEGLPDFFEENLTSERRVVKKFVNDPQVNLRAFSYQLLVVCFQLQSIKYKVILEKIYELIDDPEFQILLPDQDEPEYVSNCSSNKCKKLITEFLDYLGNHQPNIDLALAKYPIMDKMLVYLLRTMLILDERTEDYKECIQRESLYAFLTSYFDIDVILYGNCLHFVDSDIFVYEETPELVYLAYLRYQDNADLNQSGCINGNRHLVPDDDLSSVQKVVSQINIDLDLSGNQANSVTNQLSELMVDYTYSNSSGKQLREKGIDSNELIKLSISNLQTSLITNKNGEERRLFQPIEMNKSLHLERVTGEDKVDLKSIIHEVKNSDNQEMLQIEEEATEGQNQSGLSTPQCSTQENIYSFGLLTQKVKHYRTGKGTSILDQLTKTSRHESETRTKESTTRDDRKSSRVSEQQKQSLDICRPSIHSEKEEAVDSLVRKERFTSECLADAPLSMSYSISQIYKQCTPRKQQARYSAMSRFTDSEEGTFFPYKMKPKPRPNIYTKFGYLNHNISREYTDSIVLRTVIEPHRTSVRTIKKKARQERKTIHHMLH